MISLVVALFSSIFLHKGVTILSFKLLDLKTRCSSVWEPPNPIKKASR